MPKRKRVAPTFTYRPSNLQRLHPNIATVQDCASTQICQQFIELCEAKVGFTNTDHSQYTQSTTDLEVDAHRPIRKFLLRHQLIDMVSKAMKDTHRATPTGFNDMFVVKYDATGQRELKRHFDGGDVSFMLALSSRKNYTGGGTKFDCLDKEVHLAQGSMVLFDGDLYHQGLPIDGGTRYLLVGFCYTDTANECELGHINLSLKKLKRCKE
jgi:hypothetical protein|tara:strand:+ start:137 stop:769 length:633 start_codon:yes stop_codon:yes gene_type:complete